MTVAQWSALIPVVAYERFMFGIGIAGSYVILNTFLDKLVDKAKILAGVIHTEKEYIISKKLFRISA
jgi:hypothetical protein